ncbi:bifunctional diguanylate cyclase/phosphodiesterase [Polymorphospora rubra]|uniref:putative bifunctional diguanylate cyclase/phosphodiesterase n=1 Tax=Polymorphospora rubra TaxID=338584 RepID=UPI0031D00F27
MTRTNRRDAGTDRRLRLLVGPVVILAVAATVVSIYRLATAELPVRLPTLLTLTLLAAVGFTVKVTVRIRSTNHHIAWTETAILVSLALAPAEWVVLCVGVGIAAAMTVAPSRLPLIKAVFGIAKNMTLAGAAGLALHLSGWAAGQPPIEMVTPLAVAYCTAVVLDELLTLPVIAHATGKTGSELFRQHLGLRVASAVARFPVIVGTLAILRMDNWLLVAVPPLLLSLHLAYSARVRSQVERTAWKQLAQATDALNVVDLDLVLATAVHQASELFSADEVDVELTDRGRTVRGNSREIAYDGPSTDAPPAEGSVIAEKLVGHDESHDLGVVRLRFRAPVKLNERERYTLSTFASALCTAVRNASAYQELTRVADEHAEAAAHDALTGLGNRRQLLDHGTELLGQRHADGVTALLLIDLNHFKEVNDTLGHGAGDEVLIQVADRLRDAAQGDDLVVRLGGDEFAVLFQGLSAPAVATHRAERLLATLQEPLDIDGMRLRVEASGGIAVAPPSGGMPELLRRADVAMYQAKRSGGQQRIATYAPASDTADVVRLSLGGDLPRAVAEHEFCVDFQPIVDLGTGTVVAAEAIARWHHPDRGDIDPIRFLETIERSGLLATFADAVLDEALGAAETWQAAGFDLPVAVNVAPRSLLDPQFPDRVAARLRAHELPPERLFLELTETLTVSQLEVVDQVLERLRTEGVRLVLDDFGTGSSSLSVLSRIAVHELKIDRAFVMAMDTSAEARAVIRSTVDLGRSLGLSVVAEGVESEPQRHALWELGCAAGQGHLFARPMPATRMLATLRRGGGQLAPALHDEGAVVRLTSGRRPGGRGRPDRLPHLPA